MSFVEISPELTGAIRAALDVQAALRARRDALREAVESGDLEAVVRCAREYLGLH